MRSLVSVGIGTLATTLALLACSARARAETTCGSTSAGWNVPNGAIVLENSPGPVASVLAAVGEYRSHSLLSRGPDGWVTHATSITPPASGDRSLLGQECSAPINPGFLVAATPGLETVSQGAIYAFLYAGGNVNFIAYQSGQSGVTGGGNATIGNDFIGTGMSWLNWSSPQDAHQTVWAEAYNGTQIHYGWYQYMNVQGTAQGVPGVNTGVVCSSSLALWQHDALGGKPGYTGDVLPALVPEQPHYPRGASPLQRCLQRVSLASRRRLRLARLGSPGDQHVRALLRLRPVRRGGRPDGELLLEQRLHVQQLQRMEGDRLQVRRRRDQPR